MSEQLNEALWQQVIDEARQVDPLIREALRPVFERLKQDAPHLGAGFGLAMVCRALAAMSHPDGEGEALTALRREMAIRAVELVESGEWRN